MWVRDLVRVVVRVEDGVPQPLHVGLQQRRQAGDVGRGGGVEAEEEARTLLDEQRQPVREASSSELEAAVGFGSSEIYSSSFCVEKDGWFLRGSCGAFYNDNAWLVVEVQRL